MQRGEEREREIGGAILLHDCLPTSELEAQEAQNYEDAKRLNAGVAWNEAWVGDVWKAILKLRGSTLTWRRASLTVITASAWSIGRKIVPASPLHRNKLMRWPPLTLPEMHRLLGLRTPRHLMEVLGKLRLKQH